MRLASISHSCEPCLYVPNLTFQQVSRAAFSTVESTFCDMQVE